MTTRKFLHTADWHLGAPRVPPLTDYEILRSLYNLAKERSVEAVIVAGDIFDHHYPRQEVKDALLQFLVDHSDMQWIFTVGNHDYSDKGQTYHSLMYLAVLENLLPWVTVIVPGCSVTDEKVKMTYWCARSWDEIVAAEGAESYNSQGFPMVAIWHGIVPGISVKDVQSDYSGTSVEKQVKTAYKKNSNLKYIALGDIHKVCQLGPSCYYSGALVQKTFSCEDGIILFDLEGNTEVLSLGIGKKKTLNVKFTDGEDTEQAVIDFLAANFTPEENARLVFNLPQKVYASLDKKAIRDRSAKYVNSLKLDNHPTEEGRTRELAKKIRKAKTIEEELSVAIEDLDMELDEARLMDTCKRFS